ncbi:MAG: 16S rRNA pseudouridine(516) synthase [Oscillospiraceae bacterium]
MQIRLDRLISEAGAVPRQEAKKLVMTGCVTVDGLVVKKCDHKTDIASEVHLNGKKIVYETFVYIMLNKPKGVVSASKDKNDTTVTDLVAEKFPRRQLFPAGRLDKDSTGFVLLTDDGQFAHDILAPKKHVEKTYIVTLDAPITDEIVEKFNNGVVLADGTELKSAVLERLEGDFIVRVVLKQGVYHQIKRMFGVFDIGVNELHRIRIGNLPLDENLQPGGFKQLTNEDVQKIYTR